MSALTEAKTAAKRATLTDRLADHVLAHGLGGASLRPLAAALGTSDRMLLYYFADKATLIAATLTRAAERLSTELDALVPPRAMPPAELAAELDRLAAAPALAPYMALWLEIAALAARGDATCRAVGGAIAHGFIGWIAVRLDLPEADRPAAALALLRDLEGGVLLRALGVIE